MTALDLTGHPGATNGGATIGQRDRSVATPTTGATTGTPVETTRTLRLGGAGLGLGAILMIAGAIVQESSGATIFTAIDAADPAAVTAALVDVAAVRNQNVVGLSLWVAGVPLLALGATVLARLGGRSVWGDLSRLAAAASAGAAVVYFSAMIGMVVGLAPAAAAGTDVVGPARAIGVAAGTADWVVTALVLAGSVGSVVMSGRNLWAPRWLVGLAGLCAVSAVASLTFYAAGLPGAAFIDVPIGLALCLAVAVVTVRRAGSSATMAGAGR